MIGVVPSPPEHFDTDNVKGHVEEPCTKPNRRRGTRFAGKANASNDGIWIVQEIMVHAEDIQGQPRSEHDCGLRMPKIVHYGKPHEQNIVREPPDRSTEQELQAKGER